MGLILVCRLVLYSKLILYSVVLAGILLFDSPVYVSFVVCISYYCVSQNADICRLKNCSRRT